MDWLDWINQYSGAITAVATLSGVVLAIFGFNAWKRQLKGKTDYELARRYLRAALKMRDAMRFVRNPFVPIGEMERALEENGFNKSEISDYQKTNQAVYSARWKKVQDAWSELDAELLEAEVSWGKEAVEVHEPLNNKVKELFAALQLFVSGRRGALDEKNDIIYNTGQNDPFNKEVGEAIHKIEEYLKPHLR